MIKDQIKSKTTGISLVIILVFSALMLMTIPIQAQLADEQPISGPLPSGITPDFTVSPNAYLSFRPTTVGLNQVFLVNIWTTPAPGADRRHLDYTVTITKPDGTQYVVGPMPSYVDDGTNWFEWIADMTGEWTLKFDFAGTYFPAGRYLDGDVVTGSTGSLYTESVYYNPDSTIEQKLTVQEDIVYSWPPADLPNDYWTRPVHPNNREWWSILGDYPWPNNNQDYDFAGPYVIAPNTSHVVWKRQGDVSGLMGAELGINSKFEAGIGTNSAGFPAVIFEGRGYESVTKPGIGSVATCYDIRTGEVFYEIPVSEGGVTPSVVAFSSDSLTSTTRKELISIGSRLIKIHPFTGAVTTNVTGMSGDFHNGAYVLSVQNLGGGNRRLLNWTTAGNTNNFESRVVSNITWPWSNLGTTQDFNAGVAVTVSGVTGGGAYMSQEVTAVSLATGEQLWTQTVNEGVFSSSCNVADNGKVAVLGDRGHYYGFDLKTGNLAWTSPTMDYPWDEPGFGAYDVGSAYGMFYHNAYSGVYAFNWDDGTIAWKYEDPTNVYETPYITPDGTTVNSWNGGMLIADGKIYDYNTEHSPISPITRGWKLHCIDAMSGAKVWSITGFSGSRNFRGAVADGYLAFDNFYDAYMYVFGKGKTSTTVTVSPKTVAKGSMVLIEGTVMDQSPAQPNTPCVSADSMTLQMEYLHMQQPIDGIWHDQEITGVPVTLTAVSSDGTCIDLGTVTTNGYYGTFAYAWTPSSQDTYEIIASFAGDDSYGSSSAATAVAVGPALSPSTPIEPEPETPTNPEQPETPEEPETPETPEVPETPTTPEEPEAEPEAALISTELAVALAVVAACIIGAVAYFVIRKRK